MIKKFKSGLMFLVMSVFLTSLLYGQDLNKEDIMMIFWERNCSKAIKRVIRLSVWANGKTELKISYPHIQLDSSQIYFLKQNGWIIDPQVTEFPYDFRKKNILPINNAKKLFYDLLREGITKLSPFKSSENTLDGCSTLIGIKSFLLYKELLIDNPDSISNPEIKEIYFSCSDKINISQYEWIFFREMKDILDQN